MEPGRVPCGWRAMTHDVPATPSILTGRLVRQAGAFVLQCEDGGTVELRMPRVPVDHVGKSVAITGRMIAANMFEAEGVRGI